MGVLAQGLWLPDYDTLDAREKDAVLLALTFCGQAAGFWV
jgi:hypothetical protein